MKHLKPPPWKVGELARNTGMTVRALHHYDEIGLLTPSLRSKAGHRLYVRSDIERLQQIHSLRLMGIQLDVAKQLLDGEATSPHKIIEMQLTRLQDQIAAQKRLERRLRALAHHMDSTTPVTLDELCTTIEDMMKIESYFTSEQLDTLEQRRALLGDQKIRAAESSWAVVIPAVRTAMQNGVDPASPEVLELARQWKELVNEFTGGDPAIASSLRTMYENEGPALQARLGNVPTQEMFAYISRSFAALKGMHE
ncbi:MAG: MerR family transcriptional regulator [Gemmatimonadota bacterium]|nr:MerR family transcriptional regulator [Gemmatimonadota bacterium]